jgi:hypothetical protein
MKIEIINEHANILFCDAMKNGILFSKFHEEAQLTLRLTIFADLSEKSSVISMYDDSNDFCNKLTSLYIFKYIMK